MAVCTNVVFLTGAPVSQTSSNITIPGIHQEAGTGLFAWLTGDPAMLAAAALALTAILLLVLLFLQCRKAGKLADSNAELSDRLRQLQSREKNRETEQQKRTGNRLTVGKAHNIGARKSQQDSFAIADLPQGQGKFIIVADGMGGLENGDQVSQLIVRTMVEDVSHIPANYADTVLYELLSHANREVNRMLGADNLYKSGSTVVAALAEPDGFRWLAVGDSHIYLYRNHALLQLNQEHAYENELLVKAVNGMCGFREAVTHAKKEALTSFVGMGEIRQIDGTLKKVPAVAGDRLLLMSDGVYNTLSDEEMTVILDGAETVQSAAAMFEQRILARGRKNQDNFTVVIMEL